VAEDSYRGETDILQAYRQGSVFPHRSHPDPPFPIPPFFPNAPLHVLHIEKPRAVDAARRVGDDVRAGGRRARAVGAAEVQAG